MFYPSRSASGYLHGMLLQPTKSLTTNKWRFVLINVRTGELQIYKIPKSKAPTTKSRHVTEVTSYCPDHDFMRCGDLYLIVKTSEWTLHDSGRADAPSFVLRWNEAQTKEPSLDSEEEEEHTLTTANNSKAGIKLNKKSSLRKRVLSKDYGILPKSKSSSSPRIINEDNPLHVPKISRLERTESTHSLPNIEQTPPVSPDSTALAGIPHKSYHQPSSSDLKKATWLRKSLDSPPNIFRLACSTEESDSVEPFISDENELVRREMQPLLGIPANETDCAKPPKSKIPILPNTPAEESKISTLKVKSVHLKCPFGGNEKSVWIKAATELGFLVVKQSRGKSSNDGSEGVRKKIWRYRQKGQQSLDFQAMSIAIGTSRHGYSNTLNNQHRRGSKDDGKVKEFLVMPASAYPGRWMTKRELQHEVEHKSATFHNIPGASGEVISDVDLSPPQTLPGDSTSSCDSNITKQLCASIEAIREEQASIGWVEVEVLSCIGLPHADVLDKTDAFVYLVCGSHVFQTDTIFNTNSPMWPRKSKRAVRFPLKHAYARLYAGVFDNLDARRCATRMLAPHSATKTHGGNGGMFAGRVSIDLAALRPDSIYDVTLPLRHTTQMHPADARPRGAIRLRIKIHWRNERSAVLSYLPSQQATVSIPCEDRNMFRCIALTVHGTDMNGRFSLGMFKETVKEMRLIRNYFMDVFKDIHEDIHEWSNPVISAYVFAGWMHCVYRNSVTLAYPYFTGFITLCVLRNYAQHVVHKSFYAGFSPLTIQELFRALVSNTSLNTRHLKPWGVSPVKNDSSPRRLSRLLSSIVSLHGTSKKSSMTKTNESSNPYQPQAAGLLFELLGFMNDSPTYEASSFTSELWHQEFPASDPAKFPKREVRYSAAKGAAGGTTGVDFDYRDPMMEYYEEGSQNSYNSDVDSSDGETVIKQKTKSKNKFYDGVDKTREKFQSITGHLFEDRVFLIPQPEDSRNSILLKKSSLSGSEEDMYSNEYNDLRMSMDTKPGFDTVNAQAAKQARKNMEYILEMRTFRNPIMVKVEKYGRPLVMLLRVWLQAIRALINLFTWRDPYLSFWFLLLLISLTFALMIFPWRAFMLVSGIYYVGPQNMIIMQRKKMSAAKKREEEKERKNMLKLSSSLEASRHSDPLASSKDILAKTATEDAVVSESTEGSSKSSNSKSKAASRKDKSANKINVSKMEVVIPYSQVKLDRFFDWPPDPSVSFVVPDDVNSRRRRNSQTRAHRLQAQLGQISPE